MTTPPDPYDLTGAQWAAPCPDGLGRNGSRLRCHLGYAGHKRLRARYYDQSRADWGRLHTGDVDFQSLVATSLPTFWGDRIAGLPDPFPPCPTGPLGVGCTLRGFDRHHQMAVRAAPNAPADAIVHAYVPDEDGQPTTIWLDDFRSDTDRPAGGKTADSDPAASPPAGRPATSVERLEAAVAMLEQGLLDQEAELRRSMPAVDPWLVVDTSGRPVLLVLLQTIVAARTVLLQAGR